MAGQFSTYSGFIGGGGGGSGITGINSQSGPSISIVAGAGINVASGANTITITNTGSGSTTENIEYRTISSGEASAKQLTLVATPISGSKVMVDIIGGCSQIYGVDFTISTDVFDWSGYGLDGLLASGDIIRFHYLS